MAKSDSTREGGAQEGAQRLGEALEQVANAWSVKAADPSEGERSPDPIKLALAASKLSNSTLLNKLMTFAAALDARELEDLKVLLTPAVLAATAAGNNAVKPRHSSPNEFLRELDVRLSRGDIGIGSGGTAAITPTITITTITTTIASHPVIGCNLSA
jgi:hypothetical protein